MKKILIIEDDTGISLSLKIYLENSEFEVFLYETGKGAIDEIKRISPDLVILDINLPHMSGIDICRELRINSSLPVIMLTARSSELDRITGLEIGADDYIAKPFSPRELLARINTILRRSTIDNENDDSIKFKDIELIKSKKVLLVAGKEVSLTGNEYEILNSILSQNGKLVGRDTIMKDIIGYDNYMYDRTIDTHVKNLRKKLGSSDIILTVRGKGYRLNK